MSRRKGASASGRRALQEPYVGDVRPDFDVLRLRVGDGAAVDREPFERHILDSVRGVVPAQDRVWEWAATYGNAGYLDVSAVLEPEHVLFPAPFDSARIQDSAAENPDVVGVLGMNEAVNNGAAGQT